MGNSLPPAALPLPGGAGAVVQPHGPCPPQPRGLGPNVAAPPATPRHVPVSPLSRPLEGPSPGSGLVTGWRAAAPTWEAEGRSQARRVEQVKLYWFESSSAKGPLQEGSAAAPSRQAQGPVLRHPRAGGGSMKPASVCLAGQGLDGSSPTDNVVFGAGAPPLPSPPAGCVHPVHQRNRQGRKLHPSPSVPPKPDARAWCLSAQPHIPRARVWELGGSLDTRARREELLGEVQEGCAWGSCGSGHFHRRRGGRSVGPGGNAGAAAVAVSRSQPGRREAGARPGLGHTG